MYDIIWYMILYDVLYHKICIVLQYYGFIIYLIAIITFMLFIIYPNMLHDMTVEVIKKHP